MDKLLKTEYEEEAGSAEVAAAADHATADAMTERDGETTEASGYYRMRAEWAEQIARNRRETAELFGGTECQP